MLVLIISVKLRAFPGHIWVIDVFSGLSFIECIVVRLLPKLGLFAILSVLLGGSYSQIPCGVLGVLSVVIGRSLGVGSGDVRQIIGCSSIITVRWVLLVGGGLTDSR